MPMISAFGTLSDIIVLLVLFDFTYTNMLDNTFKKEKK